MFNDKYGLTNAVLKGRKTMTRRTVSSKDVFEVTDSDSGMCIVREDGTYCEYEDSDGKKWLAWTPFKVGDIIAVAQSYKSLSEEALSEGFVGDNIDMQIHFRRSQGWGK